MHSSKLYCFVDETGQDTNGKLFLVVVLLTEAHQLPQLGWRLDDVERSSKKKKLKWKKTKNKAKRLFLDKILSIKELRGQVFYAMYEADKEYARLTALTITKAVLSRNEKQYSVTVIIDGLNDKEREIVRSELKKLRIKYNKIRGMKDEQSVFLRFADAMAGFVRDGIEQTSDLQIYLQKYLELKIITKL